MSKDNGGSKKPDRVKEAFDQIKVRASLMTPEQRRMYAETLSVDGANKLAALRERLKEEMMAAQGDTDATDLYIAVLGPAQLGAPLHPMVLTMGFLCFYGLGYKAGQKARKRKKKGEKDDVIKLEDERSKDKGVGD